ncbi:MAG: transposase [Bacillota bacterium]
MFCPTGSETSETVIIMNLEETFRLEVFKMLKKEEKITDRIIENMMGWHYSGFNVYCGKRIWPSNSEGLEWLAQYIIRAPISQDRMIYILSS